MKGLKGSGSCKHTPEAGGYLNYACSGEYTAAGGGSGAKTVALQLPDPRDSPKAAFRFVADRCCGRVGARRFANIRIRIDNGATRP